MLACYTVKKTSSQLQSGKREAGSQEGKCASFYYPANQLVPKHSRVGLHEEIVVVFFTEQKNVCTGQDPSQTVNQ